MKRWFLSLALAILIGGAGAARADELYALRIDGMACPFCAYGVEKHLRKLEGVETASVQLGAGTVALTIAPEKHLTFWQIKEAVEKAGFKASEIKRVQEEK